ncbi:PspC domain-containing protein [candidate division KSB1 bacterium]|nr:PspC domain-containing protein [candidate division KSB1 bacterium]
MGFGIVIHAIKTDKAHEEKKDTHHRFYRSRSDKIIGGVCGGMAKYWNIDPKIVRIGYILLTLFSHFVVGVIAYISLLVFMQEEPDEQTGRVVVPDDTSK